MQSTNVTPYAAAPRWPFLLVLDSQYRQTGWAILNGPVVTREQKKQFVELRRAGHRFIGMSSYLKFPQQECTDLLDYELVCDAWCHCFRTPDLFLRTKLPRDLISISDFVDYQHVSPDIFNGAPPSERFDLIYVGATEAWKREAKNWQMAAKTLPRLSQELDLRVLVIGSPTDDFGPSQSVSFRETLPWPELLAHLACARFLFVPNLIDPSPRVITEALSLDVPILVNRHILGGWKYVNRFTGAFFESQADVAFAASAVCSASIAPRAWFLANYGPYHSGKRLLSLLRSLDSTINERSFLRISEGATENAPTV